MKVLNNYFLRSRKHAGQRRQSQGRLFVLRGLQAIENYVAPLSLSLSLSLFLSFG